MLEWLWSQPGCIKRSEQHGWLGHLHLQGSYTRLITHLLILASGPLREGNDHGFV